MQFEYMYTMSAQDSVEIEDVGNFCISVVNDVYQEWIMICCTTYGISKLILMNSMIRLHIHFNEWITIKISYVS